jgi:aryl-alcohol dehydrogenase-like predicted oxidoreductase
MRYRPFGLSGPSASALSLTLTDERLRRSERARLIFAALEAGINTFEIRAGNLDVATQLAEAAGAVERQMLLIMVRLGWARDAYGDPVRDVAPGALRNRLQALIDRTGFGYVDVAILDAVEGERLPPHVIPELHNARDDGLFRMAGVCGSASADPYIGKSDFDVLVTPYNLESGWGERHRVRDAARADMPVVGCDFMPASLGGAEAEESEAAGLLGRRQMRLPTAYEFMKRTPGWTAEQICLAYSLTEPSIATMQTTTTDLALLAELTEAVERDLPSWLPAQIEMARFYDRAGRSTLAQRHS